MKLQLTRRSFLRTSLAAAALPMTAPALTHSAPKLAAAPIAALPAATTPAAEAGTDGLSTYQLGPQIWIRWNNRLLTCYRAHRSQKYPYLYPLAGPLTGLSLTAETALPWPHHRSLFFGCDRVNGGNYWQEDFDRGQTLSAGPRLGKAAKDSVEILDACAWQKPGGPVVMKDARKIVVSVPDPRLRFIDFEIQWQAVEDVVIQKNNHSLFAVRAALDLTPSGGGRLVNAEGASGEKATFGQKSAWCDFSGPRENVAGRVVEGIALLDHPKNPWAPTPWFTRDYGFMSPTPMQFIEKTWELAAGKSVTLRYRVILHAGDAQEAGLDALHRKWVAGT
jgi:hypothetical protein